MIHVTKSRVTAMIGGAVVAALAAPVAWSQLASTPAGAPATPAVTAPPTLTTPAAPADGTATTIAAKTKGLHFVTGPANAQQLIADDLKALLPKLQSNQLGNPATIKVGAVLLFWRMNLSDISAGKGLESADAYYDAARKVKDYRYLLLNDGKGVGVVELGQPDGGEAHASGAAIPGEAAGIVPALAKLAELKEIEEGSFEVRFLSLGPIIGSGPSYVLWLKADDEGKDLIYPTGKASGKAAWETKLYTEEEFFKIVKPLAEQRQSRLQNSPSVGGQP